MDISHGINIDVKATLSVDEETANECRKLLNIYARSKGGVGFLVQCIEDGSCGSYLLTADGKHCPLCHRNLESED
jgi:hypothetical protein